MDDGRRELPLFSLPIDPRALSVFPLLSLPRTQQEAPAQESGPYLICVKSGFLHARIHVP